MITPAQHLRAVNRNRVKFWAEVAFAAIATFAAAGLGAWVTQRAINSGWYAQLTLPSFAPPSSLIGAVWTVLYILMVVSYALSRRNADRYDFDYQAIFAVNLLVNLAWSLVFFGQRSPLGGALVILSYMAVCIGMTAVFAKYSRVAAWLTVPLCCWVAFASALNLQIFLLNR